MKKIIALVSILLILSWLSGCYYNSETTKIYYVKYYIIHDTGIEVLAVSENGEENGFFVSKNNVYPYEENSRIIAIYDTYINAYDCDDVSVGNLKDVYLYLNKKQFIKYLEELYDVKEIK